MKDSIIENFRLCNWIEDSRRPVFLACKFILASQYFLWIFRTVSILPKIFVQIFFYSPFVFDKQCWRECKPPEEKHSNFSFSAFKHLAIKACLEIFCYGISAYMMWVYAFHFLDEENLRGMKILNYASLLKT